MCCVINNKKLPIIYTIGKSWDSVTNHSMIIKLSINTAARESVSACGTDVTGSVSFRMSPAERSCKSIVDPSRPPASDPELRFAAVLRRWWQILVALFWQVSRELSTRSTQIKFMQTIPAGECRLKNMVRKWIIYIWDDRQKDALWKLGINMIKM